MTTPTRRRLTKQITLTALLFWVPVLLFSYLANAVLERTPPTLDLMILHAIHADANPGFDRFFKVITIFGNTPTVLLAALILIVVLYIKKRRDGAILLAVSVGGAALITSLLKHLFARSRPNLWVALVHEASFSFPSGHATASAVLSACVVVIAWQTRWRWSVVVLGGVYTFVIGLSRLYLGVHYPSDVLGGWCIAFVWVYLVWVAMKPLFQKITGEARHE